MTNTTGETTDRPLIMWAVAEVTLDDEDDGEPYVHVGRIHASRAAAESDAQATRNAYEQVCEEQGEEIYALFDISVHEVHLRQWQLDKAEPMDEERHEIMTDAADAVAAGLLGFEP